MTVLDIEATLRKACVKVTHDNSVDKATRDNRKLALKILGEEFKAKGVSTEKGTVCVFI